MPFRFKYAIYMRTVDYIIVNHAFYSAFAIGGNVFFRDFLTELATMYSTPL